MALKIIIFLVLLLTPPYGWVGLFLWLVWHSICREMKKKQAGNAPAATTPSTSSATEREPELLTAKVANGHCELYTLSSGCYVRSLGSDVVQACAGRDYVSIVTRWGEVDIYSADTGCYIRRQSSDAVSAQIQGDDIAITDKNGRVTIYDLRNGSYRRCL